VVDHASPHDLTGAYVLDALDVVERTRFEHHLASCPPCTTEVAELREVTAMLGRTSDTAVPPDLRRHVLDAITTTPQEVPSQDLWVQDAPRPSHPTPEGPPAPPAAHRPSPPAVRPVAAPRPVAARRRPRGVLAGLAAAASVLVVAVAALAVTITGLQDRLASLEVAATAAREEADALVALLAADDVVVHTVRVDDVRGRVIASATLGEAVFLIEGLPPAPAAHTYELWMIAADGASPAGLVAPDRTGRVSEHLTGDLAGAMAIGITIEPDGGSPAPTTAPMMVVELG